jgi:competence protein ComEC
MKSGNPRFFERHGEFVLFGVVALLIVSVRLGWEWHRYRTFVATPLYYTHARIDAIYTPRDAADSSRRILKLHSDRGRVWYTSVYRRDLQPRQRLYLQLLPSERIGFWEYMGGAYIKSRIKRILPPEETLRSRLAAWIERQHASPLMGAWYRGIFLGETLPSQLRRAVSGLGISHLVALSGFHLGIIWGVLYGVLLVLYRPIQQRRFPHRHALVDVGGVVLIVLLGYVWLSGAPPSLIRAFAMVLTGWIMMLLGIELVSFTLLAAVALVLIALIPSLLVSLGFWLSIAGVFYIFLVLRACQHANTYLVTLVCIPVAIFVLMQPIAHAFFGMTTPWQFVSPVLSILFVPYYPVAFVLHALGAGDWLDDPLRWLLSLPDAGSSIVLPQWALVGYILLSLAAVWSRRAWYLLVGAALGWTGVLIASFV